MQDRGDAMRGFLFGLILGAIGMAVAAAYFGPYMLGLHHLERLILGPAPYDQSGGYDYRDDVAPGSQYSGDYQPSYAPADGSANDRGLEVIHNGRVLSPEEMSCADFGADILERGELVELGRDALPDGRTADGGRVQVCVRSAN